MSPLSGFIRWTLLLGCLLCCTQARAADGGPGITPRAMPGVVAMPLPAPAPRGFSLGGSVAVGWIDPVGTPPVQATRLRGGLAVAYAPIPAFDIGLDFSGRADFLSTPEQNAVSEPRVTLRAVLPMEGPLRLGVEADVRFVGVEAPSIDWAATSPSMSALVAWVPASNTWIGAMAGFHLDRSAQAVPDPSALSPADRITLGASTAPAVRVGLGATHRLESIPVTLLGEFTADLLVLGSAPPLGQSPMKLTAGGRCDLLPGLSLLASAELGLSARPAALTGPILLPIEPRLGGQLALTWSFERKEPAPPPPPVEVVPPPPPPPPPAPVAVASALSGRVVDEAGQGLPDIEVTLELEHGTETTRTLADGHFEFARVEDAVGARVTASGAGYDPAKADLLPGKERKVELVLYEAVPQGQVRGTVVDLSGRPVAAKITIDPGNQVLEVSPDGTFNIELSPGEYRLRAEHPDFAPQGRVIVVVERGVVILHIALSP